MNFFVTIQAIQRAPDFERFCKWTSQPKHRLENSNAQRKDDQG